MKIAARTTVRSSSVGINPSRAQHRTHSDSERPRLFDVPQTPARPTGRAMTVLDCLKSRSEERTPVRHLRWLTKMVRHRHRLESLETPTLVAKFRGASVPEALAIAYHVMSRTLGIAPYDVQMMGAMALFDGNIAKIGTGEGKTICAALAAALFALDGDGTHVATTNAYLAHAGADRLRPFYEALGLEVGVVELEQSDDTKRKAYAADVVYAPAEVLAFDWLEDRLAYNIEDRVQRGLHDLIVDEADDVLIDSAQTPLVLSGGAAPAGEVALRQLLVGVAESIADGMDPARHLRIESRNDRHQPVLTEAGVEFVEHALKGHPLAGPGVWSSDWGRVLNVVLQTLYARHGVRRDVAYIRGADGVVLVSSETGLAQTRSQWQDADLSAAIRRREQQSTDAESVALGEVTYRAFFGSYRRFAGMTGTTAGIEDDLRSTYKKSVASIPANRPVVRVELDDQFFVHPALRRLALLAEVARRHQQGQPVLICTVSVAASKAMSADLADPFIALAEVAMMSEAMLEATFETTTQTNLESVTTRLKTDPMARDRLKRLLEQQGIDVGVLLEHGAHDHRLLNAEVANAAAEIVASAGDRGAITVGTQIVGRGVDIPVSKEVEALGGLYVAQDERQTNARKDEQARGRAGRQGQPGVAQAFVSLSDTLFTFLPAERLRLLVDLFDSASALQPIGANRHRLEAAVRDAQREAEHVAQSTRRRSIEFDVIVEAQRRVFFERRDAIRDVPDVDELVYDWAAAALSDDEHAAFDATTRGRRVPTSFRRTMMETCDAAWRELASGTEERRLAAELGIYAKDIPVRTFHAASVEAFLEMGRELQRLIIARYIRALEV